MLINLTASAKPIAEASN